MAYTTFDECPQLPSNAFEGLIVMLDNTRAASKTQIQEYHGALCAQQHGAAAVVRVLEDFGVPGFQYYNSAGLKAEDNHVTIHVLVALQTKLSKVLHAVKSGEEVICRLSIDRNKWKDDLWDSPEFFVLWRIIFPVLNLIGIFLSAHAIVSHCRRILMGSPSLKKLLRKRKYLITTQNLMLIGALLEFASCGLRAGYGIAGPLFSTPKMTFMAHLFLVNITLPLGVFTSFIATSLFLRWGAFGEIKKLPMFERSLFVFGMLNLLSQLWASTLQAGVFGVDVGTMVVVNIVVDLIVVVVSSIIFVRHGSKLIHRLGSSGAFTIGLIALSIERRRQMSKAVKWISASGVMQLLVLICYILAAHSDTFFLSPQGFIICFSLQYCGLTITSLAQIVAFRPISFYSSRKQPEVFSLRTEPETLRTSCNSPQKGHHHVHSDLVSDEEQDCLPRKSVTDGGGRFLSPLSQKKPIGVGDVIVEGKLDSKVDEGKVESKMEEKSATLSVGQNPLLRGTSGIEYANETSFS